MPDLQADATAVLVASAPKMRVRVGRESAGHPTFDQRPWKTAEFEMRLTLCHMTRLSGQF